MYNRGKEMSKTSKMSEKSSFRLKLQEFASTLKSSISKNDDWTIRGFIDIFKNIYPVSTDTKIISKILELHLFADFECFAEQNGYKLELAEHQNWYPDITFVLKSNPSVKFAVDLKTTYKDDSYPGFCNGFTLGSHGEYFKTRSSSKNIQYPYNEYAGHFCLCVIYSRNIVSDSIKSRCYNVDEVESIPAVISDFIFFAEEKWRIASDKGGSGNTANIGSIAKIEDLINGNGVFSKAGEEYFDDYWVNFGVQQIRDKNGTWKKLSSFEDFLKSKNLPPALNNPKAAKRKLKPDEP